jgi:hypothetical protein
MNEQVFDVGVGFNIMVGKSKPKKYRPATLSQQEDRGYDLRYEPGTVVRHSELPAQALEVLDWLQERGCLIERKKEEVAPVVNEETDPEEVVDG